MNETSLYDLVAHYAQNHSDYLVAIGRNNLRKTYKDFQEDIDKVCSYVLQQGLQTGDCASLFMPSDYPHAVYIIALDRLGIASCSHLFAPEIMLGQKWWHNINSKYIFSTKNKPSSYSGNWIVIPPLEELEAPDPSTKIAIDRDPQRIIRYLPSSGSTGASKVIALPRNTCMKRNQYFLNYTADPGVDRHLVGLPYDNTVGYGHLLVIIRNGCAFIPWAETDSFLDLIVEYKANCAFLSPVTARNIAVYGEKNNLRLNNLKWITTGGTVFDMRLRDPLIRVFGKNVLNAYGSTEAWATACGWIREYTDDATYLIGKVCSFFDVQIIDEQGNLLPAGEQGILRIKSDFMVNSYFDDQDNPAFKDGYFYPGDIGSLAEDGMLSVVGRIDDRINIGGQKILPMPLEDELEKLPEIKEACCFQAATPKGLRVCAAIVLEQNNQSPEVHQALINKIQDHMQRLTPQRIFFVSELPRNTMGKVVRHELAKTLIK